MKYFINRKRFLLMVLFVCVTINVEDQYTQKYDIAAK